MPNKKKKNKKTISHQTNFCKFFSLDEIYRSSFYHPGFNKFAVSKACPQ